MVRGGAVAGLAAAVAVPLIRRRLKTPAGITAAALAAGPPSLAVVGRRTRLRDAGMYALQMWMFTMGHELPYDDPEAARRRLRVSYPIRADTVIGGGKLPSVRLQNALAGLGRRNNVEIIALGSLSSREACGVLPNACSIAWTADRAEIVSSFASTPRSSPFTIRSGFLRISFRSRRRTVSLARFPPLSRCARRAAPDAMPAFRPSSRRSVGLVGEWAGQ